MERKPNELIPIASDRSFKKVFGDPFGIQRLEGFLSVYYHIPYDDIKGKVIIIESDKRESKNINKKQDSDLIIQMEIGNVVKFLNIEVNMEKGLVIVRNITYLSYLISEFLKNKDSYNSLPIIGQINFNNFEIDKNAKTVERYYLRNENGHIFSKMISSDQINLAISEKKWYDGSINKEKIEDQGPIILGALIKITDKDELLKCLEDINMPKEIKDNIYNTTVEYSSVDSNWGVYDKELDTWKINQGNIELAKEEGIEQGAKENSIKIAKNLIRKNVDLEIISESTGLSIEELKKLS